MVNKRYLYNDVTKSNQLHDYYRGWHHAYLLRHFKKDGIFHNEYKQIVEIFQKTNKNIPEFRIMKAIPKLVRVYDPNMLLCTVPANEANGLHITYQKIQSNNQPMDKKMLSIIQSLTLPGLMQKCIDYARKNKGRKYPDKNWTQLIALFKWPTNPWFHDKFFKDYSNVCAPSWKKHVYLKTEKEKIDFMNNWFAKTGNKRMPLQKDQWYVPKGHPYELFAKFGYLIQPSPGIVWRDLGRPGQFKAAMIRDLEKGTTPTQWAKFEEHFPKEADKFKTQYPNVFNDTRRKVNRHLLSPKDQKSFDNYKEVEQLVCNDKDDFQLFRELTNAKKIRLVANHMKSLDAKRPFLSQKYKDAVNPIVENIKSKRPLFYKIYTKKIPKTIDEWYKEQTKLKSHV